MLAGPVPAPKGLPNAPLSEISAPVPVEIVYADTVPLPLLAAYRNSPDESIVTPIGSDPAANGDPVMAAKAPVEPLTVNPITLLFDPLATYKKDPVSETTGPPLRSVPAANGDPATAVKAPVVLLTEKTDTVLLPPLETNKNSPLGAIATPVGADPPVAKSEPPTAVKAPVAPLIVYAEISLEFSFAT